MGETVKFLVVDDHPIFRQGLVALVQSDCRYRVIAEAGTVAEAMTALQKELPDIALVDISLVGQNGLDLVKNIKAQYPSVRSLIISIYDEAIYAERALKAQARGYVMKQEAGSIMLEAIRTILLGHIFVSAEMRNRLLESRFGQREESDNSMLESLSNRELEVFEHIGQGYGVSEIACLLNLSAKTVGVYQEHIKKKMAIEGASDLRKYAVNWVQSQHK